MALIQVNFYSKFLMRTVTINAVIPVERMKEEYKIVEEKKLFKTLYLLHGMYGNYTDWVNNTRIQLWADGKNLAVIMPSGENSFYTDNKKSGEMYGEFIGKELVQVTRNLFPLSDKRKDTFIGGLSMGGYGAIRNGLKYPKTFSRIAALSSAILVHETVNSREDCRELITELKKKNADIPEIYLTCGTEDSLLGENQDFRDFLLENKVNTVYYEGHGAHEWTFWDSEICKVLNWLPLK